MHRFSGSDRPTWRDRARIRRAGDSVTVSEDTIREWVAEKLKDPAWVAKMRVRSDEADAQMRAMGLME